MRRVFILSWIVISIASIFSANAGEQLSPTKDGPKLADELSQKLYAQGSFQATYSSGGTNLDVSWLDLNEITNALAIVENPDSVQFSYPDNRIVSVDRQTGLLLDDSMPKPLRHNPREIKLVKQSRLESPVPYSLLIPEFNRIKFKEFPSKLFYNRLATKYFADVGQQLKTNNDFEAMFLTNSAKLIAAAREAGHEMVRADAEARATPERIMKWRNKTLIPAYKDYLKNPPVDMKDLSFTNLLVWASSIAKTNVNLMMSPGASTLVDKAIEEIPDVISTLPRDLQKPYTKINAILLAGAGVSSQVSAIEALSDLFNPFPPVAVVSGGV